jgi:hypothetical protein
MSFAAFKLTNLAVSVEPAICRYSGGRESGIQRSQLRADPQHSMENIVKLAMGRCAVASHGVLRLSRQWDRSS